jgi:dihydroorotate dehydrogenase electron transfer subunit
LMKYSGLCAVRNIIKLTEKIYSIQIECPEIAQACRPGQFIQIKLLDYQASIWPRPFSIHNAADGLITISIKKYGKITGLMEELKPGDQLYVTGPLGNSFNLPHKGREIYFAAGGVGLPPLHFYCAQLIKEGYSPGMIHFYSGARNRAELFSDTEVKKLGVDYVVGTDDGSEGIKGFITEPLSLELMRRRTGENSFEPIIFGCGPVLMMKKLTELCYNLPCYLSLEQLMPCGWGVCNGCAIKIKVKDNEQTEDERGFRLARVCREGPIFKASEVIWD